MKKIRKMLMLPKFILANLLAGILFVAPLFANVAVDNFASGLKEISEASSGGGKEDIEYDEFGIPIPKLPLPIGGFGAGKKPEGKKPEGKKPEGKKEEVKKEEKLLLTPKIQAILNFYTFLSKIQGDLKKSVGETITSENKIKGAITNFLAIARTGEGVFSKNSKEEVDSFNTLLTTLPYGDKQNGSIENVKKILGNNAPSQAGGQIDKYLDWSKKLYEEIDTFLKKTNSKESYKNAWNGLKAGQKEEIILSGKGFPDVSFNSVLSKEFLTAVDEDKVDDFINDKLKAKVKIGGKVAGKEGTSGKVSEKDVLEAMKNAPEELKTDFEAIFERVSGLAKTSGNSIQDSVLSKGIGKDLVDKITKDKKIYSENEVKALNAVKEFLNSFGANIILGISTGSEEETVTVKGCEESDKWLEKNRTTFEEKTDKQQEAFRELIKTFGKSTQYPILLQIPKNEFTDLKRTQSSQGRLILNNLSDQEKLPKILKNYSKVINTQEKYEKLSKGQRDELKGDLYLMVVLDPRILNDVIAFYKEVGLDQKDIYDLLINLYALNIGYVAALLRENDPKFTGGNKNDLDFTVGYYAALFPYRSAAEEKVKKGDEEAKKFVKEINDLNYYLQALMCRKKESLEKAGFDYTLSTRMLDDESKRVWHKGNADAFINAPWDHLITYEAGNSRLGVAINEKTGRPEQKPENEWKVIKKDQPYYRYFDVDLIEIGKEIDAYNNDAKKDRANKFESIQNLRIDFIASSIKKFYDYLLSAVGLGTQKGGKPCESCLQEDLYGLRGQELDQTKIKDGKVVLDGARQIEKSKLVDSNLEKAKKFFEGLKESKNENIQKKALEAIEQIKFIQDYKYGYYIQGYIQKLISDSEKNQ